MADSLQQAAAKFQKLADQLSGQHLRQLTMRVATQSKPDFEKEVAAALGGDMAFSGWKGHRKLKIGFEMKSDHQAEFKGKPVGMWVVAEKGRKPGARAPKKGTKILRTPWGPRRYTAARPLVIGGTTGKAVFSKGVARMGREAPKRVHAEVRKQIGEVF